MAANKTFRISKLDTKHTSSYNTLSATPQNSATHATTLGISAAEAVRRLSLLVDEGLATQAKSAKGATLDSYTQAA